MSGIYSSLIGPRSLNDMKTVDSQGKKNVKEGEKEEEKEKEGEVDEGWDGVIRRVVIGVPANCSEKKKEATRRAARCAGFEEVSVQCSAVQCSAVHRLIYVHLILDANYCISYLTVIVTLTEFINLLHKIHLMVESTAAAMAYGLLVVGTKTVLVFDMGGGES